MKNAYELIKRFDLLKPGEVIGVACSGGSDSMTLLHFLNSVKEDYDIEIVAINVDHCIRQESANDTAFVVNYCRENRIRCHKFKVDATLVARNEKISLEEAARKARYGVFEALLEKGIVDKIALAHHEQDQIETILLNLFRGTGLKGISGMEPIRDKFIRPFLNTSKKNILSYIYMNEIPFVEDSTNNDIEYSRNLLRNKIVPLIKENWPNFETNLLNFARICKQDDDYINSTINFDDLIFEKNYVKIPLYYFVYKPSIINRILRKSFEKLKLLKDIENKHLTIITQVAIEGENGVKINLPNNITAHKEYDYLTLSVKQEKKQIVPKEFLTGKRELFNGYSVKIRKTSKANFEDKTALYIDAKKLPEGAVWRTRKEGDNFERFGSGNKKLKNFFIDSKIPNRLRNEIPVLAVDNEIYVVLGYEISNKVKIDETTKQIYEIKIDK